MFVYKYITEEYSFATCRRQPVARYGETEVGVQYEEDNSFLGQILIKKLFTECRAKDLYAQVWRKYKPIRRLSSLLEILHQHLQNSPVPPFCSLCFGTSWIAVEGCGAG